MKYGLEEFRVGHWSRVCAKPFESLEDADRFIDRLREMYPFQQVRIVPLEDKPPETP